MAGFRKDKTTAAQTAANVAGGVASALIAAGKVTTVAKAAEAVTTVFDELFDKLGPVVEGDNEVFAAAEAEAEKAAPKKAASKSSGSKSKSSGSKGGGKTFTKDEALELELNSGKFKGVTIGEVLEMDEDEAAEHNHREGEAGRTYVEWLATDANPNTFTRNAAVAALEPSDED